MSLDFVFTPSAVESGHSDSVLTHMFVHTLLSGGT